MLRKNVLYPIVLLLVVFIVWKFRQSKQSEYLQIMGQTMGTINYKVIYSDSQLRDFSFSIDSLLIDFNQSLNHYLPGSEISMFNRDTSFIFVSSYFPEVLHVSEQIYEKSDGAFDPTIGSIINMWGFGPENSLADSSLVDSLKEFSGFDRLYFDSLKVIKSDFRTQLNFSAIAKGQAADVIADFLSSRLVDNYFIEIGGEIRCRGVNNSNQLWQIGIVDPLSDVVNENTFAILGVTDKGVATSANNFNYVVKNGLKYVHTIDPSTGYPVEHNLLSATVISSNCITADGYATAFMVLGLEKSIALVESETDLEAILIFSDQDGQLNSYISAGIFKNVKILDKF